MKLSRLVNCKTCGKEIAIETLKCPHCGGGNWAWFNWAVVLGIVFLVFLFVTGGFDGALLP